MRAAARRGGALVLADGETFEGELAGAPPPGGVTAGEVVFNTVMSGYQEVLTDPSYAGQIIAFTYPHIGNYGVVDADFESRRPFCRGLVVRDLVATPSSWRATASLDSFLMRCGLSCLAGVDTRRLTRHIRAAGAMVGAFGSAAEADLRAAAAAEPGTDGVDLVAAVTAERPYRRPTARADGRPPWRLSVVDFGVKTSILRRLAAFGHVEVVPAGYGAERILARRPHGVLLSNGPGDPAAVAGATDLIGGLLDAVPVFGICLGHQLLAATLGCETFKLPFGHHGGNHPVRHLASGAVEITSQNHNFSVADSGAPGVEVTHLNLNDGTVEGLRSLEAAAFGVQHHPEAGPGPHDSHHVFATLDAWLGELHGSAPDGAGFAAGCGLESDAPADR
ncbi:MAG: glutamine-hydrolyzing carbamoyl-phosphate synthase small subunit [bacterium]|nr:glutamine-hydrolyzing carbamoyl-phosphate synthase small subunit [bacterium]